MRSLIALALTLVIALGTVACGGGTTTVKTSENTVGQELQDLHAAYEQGIITEKEYEKKKKEILKK